MMLAAALLLPKLLSGDATPPAGALKLSEPRVEYRANIASATTSPWIVANGWRILRAPNQTFVYSAKGEGAGLAAAEAFTYQAGAFISADQPGAAAFGRMLETLQTVPSAELAPAADFGVVEDGSGANGELLNLLTRMNLLYRIEKSPDQKFAVNVRLGSAEYPAEAARNPADLAHKIRDRVGDDRRSLRIYGSQVVVGRLLTGAGRGRVLLLNYSLRPVLGLRVRVHGEYSKGELRASGVADGHLTDWSRDGAATEFTIPELHAFAAIDLSSK